MGKPYLYVWRVEESVMLFWITVPSGREDLVAARQKLLSQLEVHQLTVLPVIAFLPVNVRNGCVVWRDSRYICSVLLDFLSLLVC